MTPRDKEIFYFDFSDFDWLAYSKNYLKGMRVYVIKDDMSTLPEGQKKARR